MKQGTHTHRGALAAAALSFVLVSSVARAQAPCDVTAAPEWKPRIEFPWEPFATQRGDGPRWVKFTMLACDPETVYFQDSRQLAFHYDFATAHLDPVKGISREAFDAAALRAAGQQLILGAVLLPQGTFTGVPPEFGIQLVRLDPYSREEVVELFHRVRLAVDAPEGTRAYYFPAHEQAAAAREHDAFLRANGVETSSIARWATDSIVYSEGWALGRLVSTPSDEIDTAFRDGRLHASDILLTDGVPASIPSVAGLITLSPATPNSHVAILSRNFGIPFVHPVFPADVEQAQALVGRRIVLRVYEAFNGPALKLVDVEDVLDEGQIAEILALKALPPLAIQTKTPAGAFGLAVRDLGLRDAGLVGGKAANYSVLLKTLPETTREAAALTFDLWDDFMAQPLAGTDGTLGDAITERLAPFGTFPPADPAGLAEALEAVRDLIRDDELTVFSEAARDGVIATLTDERFGFDANRRLRFRSSTNVEDSDQFTGAGLYDSVSGCLADDLDGDTEGPSHCEADEDDERGVFRAIRRVFASFFDFNPFIERRRWDVDERDVGMAILVHHSFPDEEELANGVATLDRRFGTWRAHLVSQPGAISVANPEDGSQPEEVEVTFFSFSTSVIQIAPSSRLLLGENVLEFDAEYKALGEMLVAAAERFLLDAGLPQGTFDFEYKKVAPGGDLVVKQIRRLPVPSTEPSVTPFLIGAPLELDVFQGESLGNVLSDHRLGSRWSLEPRSMWLTEDNVREGLYASVAITMNDGCGGALEIGGPLAELPEHSHSWNGTDAIDSWALRDAPFPRHMRLESPRVPLLVSPAQSPLLTLADLPWPILAAEYDEPVKIWDRDLIDSTTDLVQLFPRPPSRPNDLAQVRTIEADGVTVETAFVWPAGTDGATHNPPGGELPPTGGEGESAGYPLFAGYKTAPLLRWIETRISGVTAEPIVLRHWLSQTYHPEHHNFGEVFAFEPRLEPDLAPELLAELEAKNIDVILAQVGFQGSWIRTQSGASLGNRCACVESLRGDINGDDSTDVSDAVYLLNFLFRGGPPPAVPEARRDINGDGGADVSDASYLLNWLFRGGPAPVADCVDEGEVDVESTGGLARRP